MKDNEYIAGISVRNPKDFTPKSYYEEMDAMAAYERRAKIYYLWLRLGAWVAFVLGFAVALRWISR